MLKRNCWEIMHCGREQGGANTADFGVCPAATDTSGNGMNEGINGGRICWAIAGTFCRDRVQGTYAQKAAACMNCDVFKQIKEEECSKSLSFMQAT